MNSWARINDERMWDLLSTRSVHCKNWNNFFRLHHVLSVPWIFFRPTASSYCSLIGLVRRRRHSQKSVGVKNLVIQRQRMGKWERRRRVREKRMPFPSCCVSAVKLEQLHQWIGKFRNASVKIIKKSLAHIFCHFEPNLRVVGKRAEVGCWAEICRERNGLG